MKARHEPIRDLFQNLKIRLLDHPVNFDGNKELLRKQTVKLQRKIDNIPEVQAHLDELTQRRGCLQMEKEQLFRDASAAAAELDAIKHRELLGIGADRAELEQRPGNCAM
jgi:hypothetical protein